jgi:hypothetical protein
MKVTKTTLYSKNNHSFHIGLSPLESWELLARISKESWYLETGQIAPNFLDKNQVRILVGGQNVSNY